MLFNNRQPYVDKNIAVEHRHTKVKKKLPTRLYSVANVRVWCPVVALYIYEANFIRQALEFCSLTTEVQLVPDKVALNSCWEKSERPT